MIKLQLHPDTVAKLAHELKRAGPREIGGVLVGEHVGSETFRVVDVSVQRSGGDHACFVRRPEQHRKFLDGFFARTGRDYERFNYLGEWHSHPCFAVEPSRVDVRQMQDIVEDGPSAPRFAVLMVVRLGPDQLQVGAYGFRAGHMPDMAQVAVAPRPAGDPPNPQSWWRRLLGIPAPAWAPPAQPPTQPGPQRRDTTA